MSERPDEWQTVSVDEVAAHEPNSLTIGPFGSDLVATDYRSDGVPVVFVRDIKPGRFRWKSDVFVDREKARDLNAHRVDPGDVVITKMGLPAGIAAVYPSEMESGIVTADIIRLRVDRGRAEPSFVSAALNGRDAASQVARITAGQTRPKLTLRDYRKLKISLPPLKVQRKIATILSSIDETIELTERILDENHRLTDALRDDVVTRGIGGTDENRRQTWFGKVPGGWTETTLGAIAKGDDGLQTGPFGSQLHASDYTPDGIPVLMPKDLKDGRIDAESVARVPLAIAEEMSRHRLKSGDILFGRRGEIGRSALVAEAEVGWLCGTGCIRARLTETVVPEFVVEVLRSSRLINWLNENAVGQTMLNLNTDILARTPVLLPPVAEQRRIADLLSSMVQAREATVKELGQLQVLKSALLSVLLSGGLRVTPDEVVA